MKKLIIFLLGAIILCPPISFAEETKLQTYPVKGMFLADNIKGEEFKTLFNDVNTKNMFIGKFLNSYRANFSNVADGITDRTKYNTIVSYIGVPRASKYIDKRPSGDVIYLPLTMSLNFMNILTGETIYSTSATKFGKLSNNDYKEISSEYIKLHDAILQNLINKSKDNFKPVEITTKVKDKYKNVYILDKGSEAGIAKGDV